MSGGEDLTNEDEYEAALERLAEWERTKQERKNKGEEAGPPPSSLLELLGVSPTALRQITQKTNNVQQDRYDSTLYRDLLDASEEMSHLAAQDGETWAALLQDVWATFYKAAPELTPQEQVAPSHRVNREFVRRVMEDPVTEQIRAVTMLDELSAGLAALDTGGRLLEEIKKRQDLNKAMKMAGEAAGYEADLADMEANAEGWSPDTIEGMRQKARELAHQAQQALQTAAQDMRRAVREAAGAGQQKANEVRAALVGWGIDPSDAALARVPLKDRLALVQRLTTPKMKKLAEIVGRFRNLARAKARERVKHERDEVHSITMGNDLARVLPAELAALAHPLRRLDFYRRFTEGQLLQYDLRTRQREKRGPMIVLVDASGSMNGNPMDWAVATALALVDTAYRQKRRAAVIYFDTQILREIEFTSGDRDIEKIVEVAGQAARGGTDYRPALSRALAMIQDGGGYKRADVVMVTDGVCKVDDGFLSMFVSAKEMLDFKVWSVLIGADPYKELSRWSDRVWPVRQLTEETAGELFEEVG